MQKMAKHTCTVMAKHATKHVHLDDNRLVVVEVPELAVLLVGLPEQFVVVASSAFAFRLCRKKLKHEH